MQESPKNDRKPSILFLITKSNFGGAQRYVFDLAADQKLRDTYNITVASGGEGELVDRLKESNIAVLPLTALKNSLNPMVLIKQIRELREIFKIQQPDIIHINSSMAGLAGSIAALGLSAKTIFTAHGWPFNENRNAVEKIILRFLMSLVVLLCDKTISVSKKTKSDLPWIVKKIADKKITIIYNGIDDEKVVVPNMFNRNNFDEKTIHLVSVGELHHVKGHDMIIEALSEIEKENSNSVQYHYHIMGEGAFRSTLEALILENNLNRNVTLYGNVKNAKYYLSQFDVFIMPSRSEALAYALIEAYASGIPIIFSNVGGMTEVREFASHGEMIEPNKNNFKKILTKIKDSYANEEEKPKRPTREIIFSKKEMIDKTKKVYSTLLLQS